jgi:hypothetical protein
MRSVCTTLSFKPRNLVAAISLLPEERRKLAYRHGIDTAHADVEPLLTTPVGYFG